MPFDVRQAASLVEVYDGSSEKLSQFVDAASLLSELTPADQQRVLFKFLKTRLAGKARQAICAEVGQDCAALILKVEEKCKTHTTPENLLAKLRSCKQKDSLESFCKQIETLTDELADLYVTLKVPSEVAGSLATKSGVESLISGIPNAETKTILKAASFKTIGDAVQKVLENSNTHSENSARMEPKIYSARSNRFYSAGRSRGYRGRGRGRFFNNGNQWSNNGRFFDNGNQNRRYQNRGRGRSNRPIYCAHAQQNQPECHEEQPVRHQCNSRHTMSQQQQTTNNHPLGVTLGQHAHFQ